MFTSVAYKELGNVPAQVNRKTGELFINPEIWKNIPEDHKDYILLHERGHLELMTADEYQVNRYAVGKYLEAGKLNDSEFNRRIVVLSEVLSDDDSKYLSNASVDTGSAISSLGGLISPIFEGLSILGIGSKAKQKEINLSIEAEKEKAKSTQKTIIVSGAILLVIVVMILILKK